MTPLFTLLTIGISIILIYTIYLIMNLKRQVKPNHLQTEESILDDVSYIQEIKHLSGKVGFVLWQQYDILLATRPYGWETMVDFAAYLESADLDNIDSISIADIPCGPTTELAHVYNKSKAGLKNFNKLTEEKSSLGIAGHSRALNESVKIVWFNQTRMLRIFTLINDETLITKYAETVIRRTFGTKDAMKLAKRYSE